jgi:hypothetical protein
LFGLRHKIGKSATANRMKLNQHSKKLWGHSQWCIKVVLSLLIDLPPKQKFNVTVLLTKKENKILRNHPLLSLLYWEFEMQAGKENQGPSFEGLGGHMPPPNDFFSLLYLDFFWNSYSSNIRLEFMDATLFILEIN